MLVLVWIAIGFSGFSYLGVLLLLEKLKVFILFEISKWLSGDQLLGFLIFMVVATIEVVVGLVILTRLWKRDSLIQ